MGSQGRPNWLERLRGYLKPTDVTQSTWLGGISEAGTWQSEQGLCFMFVFSESVEFGPRMHLEHVFEK